MRTRRLFFAFLAFSVAGFAACDDVKYGDAPQKPPVEKDIAVSIKSPGAELTRTVIAEGEDNYSVLWEVGNTIGVFTSGDAGNANNQFSIKEKGITDGVATFSGTFAAATTGTVAVYAYHPYDVNATDATAVGMTLPAMQTMTRKSFDTAAGLLAGVSKNATIDGKTLEVTDYAFKSLGAMINISAGIDTAHPPVEGVKTTEVVSKIILEAPESKVLSGPFTVNLTNGVATYPTTASEGSNILELNVPANTTIDKLNAWLVSLPFSLATTDELKVTIVAGVYTIEKTFTAQEFTFTTSAVEELYVSIDDECEITIDPNAPVHPDAPAATYIMGAATEFGNTGKAMRKVSDNVFEIYTELTEGEFGFSDNPQEGIKYTLINNELYTGTTGIASAKEGIYYIKVDFANHSVTRQEVTNVSWWRCWTKSTVDMEYVGNGKWKADNVDTKMGENHGDSRYRFMANQGTESFIWGYGSADHNRPATPADSYYYINIRPQGSINQWDYGFKFPDAWMGSYVDFVLDMSPDATAYTHSVALSAIDITLGELTHPEADESFILAANGDITFSWANSTVETGTITYEVAFYKDAAGTTPLARKGTNLTTTSLHVSYADLNTIAALAGIEPAQSGDIYWTVVSKVGSQEAAAAIRKLTVSRIQTSVEIPSAVYISGAGTEYGDAISGAKAMRKISDGIFEVYCQLTTGSTLRLTNGKTGSYLTYAINNNSLINGDAGSTIATPSATSVYRVTTDFNTGSLTYVTIGSVWFERGFARAQDSRALNYKGDGKWEYPSHTYADNDERYHFRISYTIGGDPVSDGGKWDEKWGNFVEDTQVKAQEWNINVMIGSANFGPQPDWSYSFKLRERNPGTGVLTLDMNAAMPTHSYVWQ